MFEQETVWNNYHYFIILTMFNTEQTCLLEYMEYTGLLAKYETSKTTALNLIIFFLSTTVPYSCNLQIRLFNLRRRPNSVLG